MRDTGRLAPTRMCCTPAMGDILETGEPVLCRGHACFLLSAMA